MEEENVEEEVVDEVVDEAVTEEKEETESVVPEKYQELGREEKVVKSMLDAQYSISDVLRTIRLTLKQGAVPDKSLLEKLQNKIDLLKEYREVY